MAARKKEIDTTDILLYGGILLLILLFFFQWSKIANAVGGAGQSIGDSIGQAFTNTLSSIEGGLANLVTTPLSFLSYLLSAIPGFFSAIFSGLFSLISGSFLDNITGGLFTGISALSSATALPINQGTGASYPATIQGTPQDAQGSFGGDGISSFSAYNGQ